MGLVELRGSDLGFGHAGSRAAHDGGETPREFTDAIGLVQEHRFARDQLLADAESGSPGEEVVGGVLLRDAAAGNQGDFGERPAQRADVVISANQRSGENLDEIGSGFPGGENFGGSHGTGHHDDVGKSRDIVDRGDVQRRAADELGASVNAPARRIHVKDRARAKNNARNFFHQIADDVEGAWDGHGEFNDRDASVGDLFHGKARILLRRGADHGYETYFFNAGTQLLLFHGWKNLRGPFAGDGPGAGEANFSYSIIVGAGRISSQTAAARGGRQSGRLSEGRREPCHEKRPRRAEQKR